MRNLIIFLFLLSAVSSLIFASDNNSGSRTIYLIRHGYYDYKDTSDADIGKALVPLGIAQAKLVAERLREMPVQITSIVTSTMTRARQTAEIIKEAFPDVVFEQSRLIRECTPPTWREDIMAKESLEDTELCNENVNKAFGKYFIPSDTKEDKYDVLVCHGNFIRALVVRALQVDPESWLNMSISNCSITTITINGDGNMKLISYNDTGHMPENMTTTTGADNDKKSFQILIDR
jgi:serine/threonine-protein phosphatase PGAM5